MARNYAGTLGLLAFATVVVRSLIHNHAGGQTIWLASVMLFGFAALGYAIGLTAQWIIDDSVRHLLASEINTKSAARSEKETPKPTVVPQ